MLFLILLHSQLFIWQAHNALFLIRCLLKVFIREMSEEELQQQFSYQERAPGSCAGEHSCCITGNGCVSLGRYNILALCQIAEFLRLLF